jgi:heme a synthase
MRFWLVVAAALVLAIATASAMLRLSLAGVGCTPWPACYAERSALQPWQPGSDAAAGPAMSAMQSAVRVGESVTTPEPPWHAGVRLAHRISASAAGLVFLFVVLMGWSRWTAGERVAGLLLLAVSAGLALLGRYTPSTLPVVVLANLIGGHLLLAALAWLLAARAASRWPSYRSVERRRPGGNAWLPVAALLVGLLLLQEGLGSLVSARAAAAACDRGCALADLSSAGAAAFDVLRSNAELSARDAAAAAPTMDAPARRAVLQAHTLGSFAVLLVALWAAWRARYAAPAAAALLLLSLIAAATLGWAMRLQPMPLAAAVGHSVLAALALAAAAAVWRRTAPR